MSIEGWYYLHTNGELIFKREIDGNMAADIRESTFARALWPCDPSDRGCAWTLLVESLAAGAKKDRVLQLATKWGCDDEDAQEYAERVGIILEPDGNAWCAKRKDFICLQESPAGFGGTALEAMANLCSELGYKPMKLWGVGFSDLVSVPPVKESGETK